MKTICTGISTVNQTPIHSTQIGRKKVQCCTTRIRVAPNLTFSSSAEAEFWNSNSAGAEAEVG